MSGVAPKPGRTLDLDQVTAALVRRFESGGTQTLGNPQPLAVAGAQGRSVALQSTSPFQDANGQPQQERDWLVTVSTPDRGVISFVFVAPQAQFDRFRPTFERMLQNVQF